MKILIIGAGYVGSALGLFLQNHFEVTVTTRSEEKLQYLSKNFEKVELLDTSDTIKLTSLIMQNDVIVLTVAAKNIKEYDKVYLESAKNLKKVLQTTNHSVQQLIYTSASSVYGDQKGLSTFEDSPLKAKTPSGKILIETEKTLMGLNRDKLKVCIFRLSEIYGPGREISLRVKRLSELSAPGTGENHTNMIYLDDILSAIKFALVERLQGIFNLTDDDHIKRKDMYEIVSKKFNLPSVVFDPEKTSIHGGNKILTNEKIKKAGFKFLHPKRIYN